MARIMGGAMRNRQCRWEIVSATVCPQESKRMTLGVPMKPQYLGRDLEIMSGA